MIIVLFLLAQSVLRHFILPELELLLFHDQVRLSEPASYPVSMDSMSAQAQPGEIVMACVICARILYSLQNYSSVLGAENVPISILSPPKSAPSLTLLRSS